MFLAELSMGFANTSKLSSVCQHLPHANLQAKWRLGYKTSSILCTVTRAAQTAHCGAWDVALFIAAFHTM